MNFPHLNRRQMLLGSAAAWVDATARRAYAREAAPGSGSTDEATRRRWIGVAEGLKPKLAETVQEPRAVVTAVADPSRFLRWRMEDVPDGAALAGRTFRKGDSFMLDFGGHRTGYLEFVLEGVGPSVDAPAWLRFTFGEVPGDVAEPLFPYHGSLSSSWLPVDEVKIDFLPQRVRMPRRYAFRYVRVEVLDTSPNYAARFREVRAVAVTSAPGLARALAAGAPAWVQRVDAVSLATLRDCMQTTFEDGPRRDQRLWIGDLRLQARASYLTFPNFGLVKRCLYLFAALSRASDGFLPACVFEKPAPLTTDTFIADYAALYGAVVLDYVRATGDMQAGRELWPVARRQMELLLANVDAAGVFHSPPKMWAFVDWSMELDRTAAMQGVMVYSGRALLALAKLLGTEAEVAGYPALMTKMVSAARGTFYDAAAGVCVSGPARQVSWASQAWMVLGGCITGEEARGALRKAVLEDLDAVKPTTPYLYHHVVEAMVVSGMRTEALALIQGYWGGMVDAGADTFWEAYDPKDSRYSPYGDVHINSFCHAWSCTPAYFFRADSGALLQGVGSG